MRTLLAAVAVAALLCACNQEASLQQPGAAAAAMTATASAKDAAEEKREARELCKSFEDLAAQIMEGRQAGTPMSGMMEIAAGDALTEAIISRAYEQPRMNLPENRARFVEDYRNEIYLECIQNLKAGS